MSAHLRISNLTSKLVESKDTQGIFSENVVEQSISSELCNVSRQVLSIQGFQLCLTLVELFTISL